MLEIVCSFTDETEPEKITSDESILFKVSTLRVATSYFSQENKIGEGGFGEVYKVLVVIATLVGVLHAF